MEGVYRSCIRIRSGVIFEGNRAYFRIGGFPT